MSRIPTIKRLANRAKDLMFLPGTERLWIRRLNGKVMALVYHRVDDPARHAFLERGGTPVIRPEALAEELGWLKDHGARFLTFADLRRGEYPEDNQFGVVVTFDDGFRDNYTTGLEVLDGLGIKGVVFQCSAMIDGLELIPEHALYWFASRPDVAPAFIEMAHTMRWQLEQNATEEQLLKKIITWVCTVPKDLLKYVVLELNEQYPLLQPVSSLYPKTMDIRRAVEKGHEIGSHGHEHLHRATLSATEFERELSLSSSLIEVAARVKPEVFSYPFNGYLAGDRDICAGYFTQVLTVEGTLIHHKSNPLEMGRFSWPGSTCKRLRRRRWLLTGSI